MMAREGANILGFASFKDGWLNHLNIAPSHWRKGVGAKLLAAQRLYETRGFVECERTDGAGR